MPETYAARVRLVPEHRRLSRQRVEHLLGLSEHLRDEDRLLLEQVYRGHLTLADAGRLTGRNPRGLARRLARIVRRLRHPLFAYLAANKDFVDPDIARTAELVVFGRRSLRRAAQESGRSLHQVRQDMRSLRVLAGVGPRFFTTEARRHGEERDRNNQE